MKRATSVLLLCLLLAGCVQPQPGPGPDPDPDLRILSNDSGQVVADKVSRAFTLALAKALRKSADDASEYEGSGEWVDESTAAETSKAFGAFEGIDAWIEAQLGDDWDPAKAERIADALAEGFEARGKEASK